MSKPGQAERENILNPDPDRRKFLYLAGLGGLVLAAQACGFLSKNPTPAPPETTPSPSKPQAIGPNQKEFEIYSSIVTSGDNIFYLARKTILERHKILTVDKTVEYSWDTIAQDPEASIYQLADNKSQLLSKVTGVTSNLAPSRGGKIIFATGEGNILELGSQDRSPVTIHELGEAFKSVSVLATHRSQALPSEGYIAFIQNRELYTIRLHDVGLKDEPFKRIIHVMDAKIDISPTGEQIAYTHWSGVPYYELRIFDVRKEIAIPVDKFFSKSPEWHMDEADGRLAYVATGGNYNQAEGIYILKPPGTSQRIELTHRDPILPRWSPEGNQLAYIATDYELVYIPTDPHKPLKEWGRRYLSIANLEEGTSRKVAGSLDVSEYAWLPDAKRVAMIINDSTTGSGSTVRILDITA